MHRQPGVLVASTPPGAQVYVDGRDSGFVTPAALALPRNAWHRVDVVLTGYEPATRLLGPGGQTFVIPWTDGYLGPLTWYFPLWLSVEELFFPLRVQNDLDPDRIHVRLRLTEAP